MATCLIVAALFLHRYVDMRVAESAETLRLALVEKQRYQIRWQRIIKEGKGTFINSIGEDISSLQVRVAEFLAEDSSNSEKLVSYEQRLLSQSLNYQDLISVPAHGDVHMQTLRLNLELQVRHAPLLLDWISRLAASVGGWPAEIRSCDVLKRVSSGLLASCTMDIYHWQFHRDV